MYFWYGGKLCFGVESMVEFWEFTKERFLIVATPFPLRPHPNRGYLISLWKETKKQRNKETKKQKSKEEIKKERKMVSSLNPKIKATKIPMLNKYAW